MIRHKKVSTLPAGKDPTKVRGADWNDDHAIDDPAALSAAIGIHVVSGDPNGVLSAPRGCLAHDTLLGQLWMNTSPVSGTLWTSLLRSDGGALAPATAFAFFGDSNTLGMGVTTDKAVRWNNVVSGGSAVPRTSVVENVLSSTASNEPLAIVDLGTSDLKAHNVATFPGFGDELSMGPLLFDLLNGVGAVETDLNRPWFIKWGISGITLKQLLPSSTFGLATPAFGGRNAYDAWKTRLQALLAVAARRLGGVFIKAGGNDGVNSTDAGNVAAGMVALATQIRSDFGQQVAIVWTKLHASAAVAFAALVRSQMESGIALIPNSKLVRIDSYPTNSDNLHFGADATWDMGVQHLEAMRRLRGIPARTVTRPTVVGYGTPSFNAPTLTPRGWPGSVQKDTELLFVAAMKNSGGGAASPAIPTPTGWTLLGTLGQTIANTQTQQAAIFRRDLAQADLDANDGLPPPVSVVHGNDEGYAVRVTVRGATGIAGAVSVFAAAGFGTSSVSSPGPTTAGINDLVLTFVCSQGGGTSLTEHYAATNASTNPQLVFDAPLLMNTTNSGLMALFAGTRATAGAVPPTTVTPSIPTNPSGFTLALTAGT